MFSFDPNVFLNQHPMGHLERCTAVDKKRKMCPECYVTFSESGIDTDLVALCLGRGDSAWKDTCLLIYQKRTIGKIGD